MDKFLHIVAKIVCVVLHPMMMPCYGMLMFFASHQSTIAMLPRIYSTFCIVGTLMLTLLIPSALLLLMWRKGYIDSLHLDQAKQRTAPYIYTLMCYGFWVHFLHSIVHMPSCIVWIALSACITLVAVTVINLKWKISAHLTGIGGLLGGICSFGLCYSQLSITLIIIVISLALLLMYARLYLNAHTPLQVVCGFLLGISCTFIPTFILAYA